MVSRRVIVTISDMCPDEQCTAWRITKCRIVGVSTPCWVAGGWCGDRGITERAVNTFSGYGNGNDSGDGSGLVRLFRTRKLNPLGVAGEID